MAHGMILGNHAAGMVAMPHWGSGSQKDVSSVAIRMSASRAIHSPCCRVIP